MNLRTVGSDSPHIDAVDQEIAPVAAPVTAIQSVSISRAFQLSPYWLIVAFALLLQWSLFSAFVNREIVPYHPIGYDQSGYLLYTYETFDHMVNDGFWNGLKHGMAMKLANGKMMHLQASILMLFTGASRLGALTLNFIYFAALQCIAVYTLLSLTRRWSMAFLGLSLLLITHSRFLIVGGMADFRLDHIALCLYGIFVCLVIRSGVFASMWWSLAAGAAGAMLILFRFLTALTLACVMASLLVSLCLLYWRSAGQARAAAGQRIRGLLSSGALISVLVAPALWFSREVLRDYYIGEVAKHHDTIRAVEYGAVGPLMYWLFYVRSLAVEHLGMMFLIISALIILSVYVAARPSLQPAWPGLDAWMSILFLVIAFLVPLALLTLYPVRNPIVVNILTMPVLGLVMAIVAGSAAAAVPARPAVSRTILALAGATACFACYNELSMWALRNPLAVDRTSAAQIVQLYDDMGVRAQQFRWTAPRIMMDRAQDYLVLSHLTCLTYEHRGTYIRPQPSVQGDIDAVPPDVALEAVHNADFAVITDAESPEGPGFAFPFNAAMKQIQPRLRAAAERYLVPVSHFDAYSHSFTLYMRPPVQVEGDSGGWVTSQGITLTTPGDMLRKRPNIELVGTTFGTEYLRNITARAQLEDAAALKDEPVEVTLPIVSKTVVTYRIVVKVKPDDIAKSEESRIHLSFDRFFIPKNVGINQDTRKLVIMVPKQVTLLQ